MKKLLFSFIVLGITSVLAIGATSAYFSDEEVVEGNRFTTGTIEITQNYGVESFIIENWKPGDEKSRIVRFVNTGSLPIGSFTVNIVPTDDSDPLLSQINVRVHCKDPNGVNIGQVVSLQNILTGLDNADLLDGASGTFDTIEVGQTHHCKFRYSMISSSNSNDFQGATASFDLVFTATQEI